VTPEFERFGQGRATFTIHRAVWGPGVRSRREAFLFPEELVLREVNLGPESAVFIDDNPRNAAAAHALGIHGIHFRTPELLRRELETIGIL